MSGFFKEIGVLAINHIAVTTNDLEKTCEDWLSLPGSKILKGPGVNVTQKCKFVFIKTTDGSVVEILTPLDESSPIYAHLSLGGGTYHYCFAVDDIKSSIASAEHYGALTIVGPVSDIAFNGDQVAFLIHKDHGLFELVEVDGAVTEQQHAELLEDKNTKYETRPNANNENKLREIIHKVFPKSKNLNTHELLPENISQWDSLGQLRLIMEVENTFRIKIPANKLGEFNNFQSLLTFINNKKTR